nr:RHS repeat domain-containing protein [Pantoea stewartii]
MWDYDAAGQVTKAVEPQKEERFFWDAAGNRTEEQLCLMSTKEGVSTRCSVCR